ncbi:hypothetical protein [Idiomarina abyssalis]|uniref:hypothetical protein n=1 Tax=Idiomarina abyssalis TaxID=86102 RepID=UPI001CD636D7|nr:hypothetical protein [Idiomarina abyssalis]
MMKVPEFPKPVDPLNPPDNNELDEEELSQGEEKQIILYAGKLDTSASSRIHAYSRKLIRLSYLTDEIKELVLDIDSIRTRTIRRASVSTSLILIAAMLLNGFTLLDISILGLDITEANQALATNLLFTFLTVTILMYSFATKRDILSFNALVSDLHLNIKQAYSDTEEFQSRLEQEGISNNNNAMKLLLKTYETSIGGVDKSERAVQVQEGFDYVVSFEKKWGKAIDLTNYWRGFDQKYPIVLYSFTVILLVYSCFVS